MDQATCTRFYQTIQEVKRGETSLTRLGEIASEFGIDPKNLVNAVMNSRQKEPDDDYDPCCVERLFYPDASMQDFTIEYLKEGKVVHRKFIVNWQDGSAPYDAGGNTFELCVRSGKDDKILYQGAPCVPLYDYVRTMDGGWSDGFSLELASAGQIDAAVEYLKHPLGNQFCPLKLTKIFMERINKGEMCYLRLVEALIENVETNASEVNEPDLTEQERDQCYEALRSERNEIIRIVSEYQAIQPNNYNHDMRPLLEFVIKNQIVGHWSLELIIGDLSRTGTIFATHSRVENNGQYIECLASLPGFNMACLEQMLVSIAMSSSDEENLLWFVRRLVPLANEAGNHLCESFSITNVLSQLLNSSIRQSVFVDFELKPKQSEKFSRVFAILDRFARSFLANSTGTRISAIFYNPDNKFLSGSFLPQVDDFFECSREWITSTSVCREQSVPRNPESHAGEESDSDDDSNSKNDATREELMDLLEKTNQDLALIKMKKEVLVQAIHTMKRLDTVPDDKRLDSSSSSEDDSDDEDYKPNLGPNEESDSDDDESRPERCESDLDRESDSDGDDSDKDYKPNSESDDESDEDYTTASDSDEDSSDSEEEEEEFSRYVSILSVMAGHKVPPSYVSVGEKSFRTIMMENYFTGKERYIPLVRRNSVVMDLWRKYQKCLSERTPKKPHSASQGILKKGPDSKRGTVKRIQRKLPLKGSRK